MSRSIFARTLIVLITATILTTPTKADTIYVDDDAPPGGDGTSWNTAFRDLQDALDCAGEGTTVRVAGGTYRPDRGTLDRTLSFQLQEGVALYGGYAGLSDPNNPDARDFTAYPSILTGDLYGDDDAGGSCAFPWSDCCVPHSGAGCDSAGCSSRVCDGWCLEEGCKWWECKDWDPNTGECLEWVCMQWGCIEWAEELPWCCDPNNDWTEECADAARTRCDECLDYSEEPSCENSLRVVRGSDIDSTTVLDGFVVAHGNARSTSESINRGGGMWLNGASPAIRNCTFTHNHATSRGAGAYSLSGNPSFTDCTFVGNGDHPSPWQPSVGGGIYVEGGSPTFTRCNFEANGASTGAGVFSRESTTTFIDCTFHDNYGGDGGGGIGAWECTTTLVNCAFYGNTQPGVGAGGGLRVYEGTLTAANCLFVGNSRGSVGAVYTYGGIFDFVNCVFHSNNSGGVRGYGSTLTNCIVWNNTSYQLSSAVVATYSDVQDGWPGAGNIDADPAFVRDPSDGGDGWGDSIHTPDVDEGANDDYGDLHLTWGSPCIDAGDNTAVPPDEFDLDGDDDTTEPLPFDLDGEPRFVDDLATEDTGYGDPPIVDMGAYEYQPEPCPDDYDCDGIPDGEDNCPYHPNPDQADCDDDGYGDFCTIYQCDGSAWCSDCNENDVPDGCDLDPNDPDGNGEVSDDYDLNGVPDECDPDCNSNGMPDACDLDCATGDCASHPLGCGTSMDCQPNGIPDECDLDPNDPDGDGQVSEDCQPNGIPDECDIAACDPNDPACQDCNGNGIPDGCDIAACDPNDPACQDCNANGIPDECDIAACDPNDPACQDCNANGIPDECDIAACDPNDPACQDCNANGIPDECDIAACDPNDPACQDCNGNGIPDECDIAACDPNDPACQDCNANGVPDECDIGVPGAGFDDPSFWTTFDAGANGVGDDPDGYQGAVFDGQYVYFVPYHNGSDYHAEVLRYDTPGVFDAPPSWATFDPGDHGIGDDPDGYRGAAFDNIHGYIYFAPYNNGTEYHGEVLRYDANGDFSDPSSWATYDPGDHGVGNDPDGYVGAVFDGRYVYPAPAYNGSAYHGELLRYDSDGAFDDVSSWATFDAEAGPLGAKGGYQGAVFDGRYVYFVPDYDGSQYHGEVLRYDTTAPFDQVSAWSAFDAGEHGVGSDPDGYYGAVFDGRYVYFVPCLNDTAYHGEVLRYDAEAEFSDSSSWAAYNPGGEGVGNNPAGYRGAVFDGRYVYFVPWRRDSAYHGEVLRYDTAGPFQDVVSWDAFDAGDHGVGSDPDGYIEGVFDGRYVYFGPYNNGSGKHGEVLRYDTSSGGGSSDENGNGVPDECEIPGDLDGDGDVDLSDLAQLLSNYGMTEGATYQDGDLNGDGDVDLSDLAALLANYGTGT